MFGIKKKLKREFTLEILTDEQQPKTVAIIKDGELEIEKGYTAIFHAFGKSFPVTNDGCVDFSKVE